MILPVVFKAVIELAAAQGDDGVGVANGPEHAELFEAGTDHGLASGFDDARADNKRCWLRNSGLLIRSAFFSK